MRTFETPEPISVSLELGVGDIEVVASDRVDTVVDVRPSDPANRSDVSAARQTRVDLANGTLVVKAMKGWRRWTLGPGRESIDVRIELPSGSTVRAAVGAGGMRCRGRIGGCHVRTGVGDITLDRTGPVELKAGAGEVAVDAIAGTAKIKTAGAVRIGTIDGSAVIRNANGDTWIGEITGDARVTAANGAISVDLAHSGVAAKTANGDIRIDEVTRGAVVAQSAFGAVEVGVADGVPAWLDLETGFGHVTNELDDAERPGPGDDAVEVRAHTAMGDITIHRSSASRTHEGER